MNRRADIFRSTRTSSLGHSAKAAAGWHAGSALFSRHGVAFAAASHLVKWRLTKDSPNLHVSEPIRTGGAALMEARALRQAGAWEVWVELPDGTRLEADGAVRKN